MFPADPSDRPRWWHTGVVYQIYPRSFQDSNGDGIGDLPGIISRLDYLVELGIDAIWVSPFYPSPMADFGYDVSDYCDIDPCFGTLADFDELLGSAHARGLRVIVDIVANHTSDRHPWFIESRGSRSNPKRDWYVWRDGRTDGQPPNNWLATFGGPAWTFDETTAQWYLHSFLPEQPDLNWRDPALKGAMFDMLRFWLDRGVDGFRIDVAHAIMKDPDLRDNPPAPQLHPDAYKDLGEYSSQLHVMDRGHADIHPLYREWRALLDSYGDDRFMVGEIHLADWTEWASYYGGGDEVHMPFNFAMLAATRPGMWKPAYARRLVEGCEAAVAGRATAWPNWVFGNHDEGRVASKLGQAQARVAMMLLLTLRGQPTLYYGDEIAMEDVPIPPEIEQDPWGKRVPGLGRDPARTPMQWDATPNAGFTSQDGTPWLPVASSFGERNVVAQRADPTSMLVLTKSLLELRRREPALNCGTFSALDGLPDTVFGFERRAPAATGAESRLAVLANFDHTAVTIDLTPTRLMIAEVLLSTSPSRGRVGGTADDKLELDGDEAVVVRVVERP